MALSKRVVAGLAALTVAAVVVVAAFTIDWLGNTSTPLKLEGSGSACAITTPINDKDVTVKKGKKITWQIQNACDKAQIVNVGNVRLNQADPGGPTNCKAGMEESPWPFKAQDQGRRSVYLEAGSRGEIVLKEAKNEESKPVIYYFDICLGGTKKDPRLVVDPY